ncbi:ankyrin repeat domain-containing protein [Candidatus Babeliales bacterium]|nr:ankyrin repeat domain-containing protein [Candidatus Babeliales bacterium]
MKQKLLLAILTVIGIQSVQAAVPKTTQTRIINLMKDYEKGDTAGLSQAYQKTPTDFINWQTTGYTPNALMYATYEGNHYPKVVKYLTQQSLIKQHINDTNKNGSTALHMAVQQKNTENINTLLNAGINPAIKNKSKLTAFGYANKRKGYSTIVTVLKEHGIKE